MEAPTLCAAAELIGRAVRKVRDVQGEALEHAKINFEVTMLFGGQIAGGRMRLFMIYSAGNFIEATRDTPYLQIGEHKYGKPVLDRAVEYDTRVDDALKLALISMDSTMRSNLGVGLPIDIAVLPRDTMVLEVDHRIDNVDPYYHDLRDRWSVALRAAHIAIPRPPYLKNLPKTS
jgi:putative proteasome-type protease